MNNHKPDLDEKIFFLMSGALISTPFPALFNSLIGFLLLQDLPRFYASAVTISFVAPVLEEFAKAYPLFYRHGETRRSLVTLGFLSGLGFGIAEFILYVYFYNVPPVIRLPLLLFHAANTVIVAYGIAVKKPLPYYLAAVALHALNNLFSLFNLWLVGGFIAVILSYRYALKLYQKVKSQDEILY